jgi:hypothetical protein
MRRLMVVAVLALGVLGGTARAAYTYVGVRCASCGEWLVTQSGYGMPRPPAAAEQDDLLIGFVSAVGYPAPDYGTDPGTSGDDYWEAAWAENH